MKFHPTSLAGAFTIELTPFQDKRGLFARTFCMEEFSSIGHTKPFLQINHSRTLGKGSIRGMHFQVPPSTEVKLIRCIRGKIWDVIVDIRKDSPTFLHHIAVELSAENMHMIYVPEGFAHGFQTLTEEVEMIYHHTAFYDKPHERGLPYNDPRLGIQWPLPPINLSERDLSHPSVNENFEGIRVPMEKEPGLPA